VADRDRFGDLHRRPGGVGVLGGGHPLAALLPGVDVHRHRRFDSAAKPVGLLSAAGLWAYTNVFVTSFLVSGLRHLMTMDRPDQIIAVPAWLANVIVVIGCVWGYARLTKRGADVARFAVAFALTTGFFALDMYLFQPRYLGIFPRLLHPHLPSL
jgi:hypothetical protein